MVTIITGVRTLAQAIGLTQPVTNVECGDDGLHQGMAVTALNCGRWSHIILVVFKGIQVINFLNFPCANKLFVCFALIQLSHGLLGG